ncbi:MAG: TonB-dependent receptor [Verrucomicrobiota bacterium]
MKHTTSLACAVACAISFARPLHAEETVTREPDVFAPLVVSALKTPRDPESVTSAVTVLDPRTAEERGVYQLQDALNLSPGVISTSIAGQTGSVGSLFIRGTTTGYSQLVVDGVRLSDSTTPLGNMLAAGRTWDLGRIEILRGPQGALYGGESVGGVLWLETPRGSGRPGGSATFEGGSFGTLSGFAKSHGEKDGFSWFVAGGFEDTNNDGSDLSFHQGSLALRAEGAASEDWTVGTTLRAVDGFYENGGLSDDHFDSSLATVYANGRVSDVWTARFLLGYQQEFYDSDSSFGNFGTDLRTGSFTTDHEIKLADNLKLLAGAYVQESSFENTIGTDERRTRHGLSTALEHEIVPDLTATAALRWEDYEEYGDEWTWRTGVVRHFRKTGTSLRGGIGSSFRAPSYLDLFGSSFGAGNPNLDAESSVGWDVGIAQEFLENHAFELTWFHNDVDDRIQSFPAPPVNVSGTTETNGLEAGVRGEWENPAVRYQIAWTWLHESFSDQPRNAITGVLDWRPVDKALVGIGATHLASRSWGGTPVDAYTVARLFGSYELTDRVKLHARVENLLGENYEISNFFGSIQQGAGTGVYGGITVDW